MDPSHLSRRFCLSVYLLFVISVLCMVVWFGESVSIALCRMYCTVQ